MRRSILIATIVSAIFAPSASADGLPVLGVDDGSTGVTVPQAASRYVTIPAPGGGTLVERINRNGGEVLASSLFPGVFTIPAVAYDGAAGGLSGDRHTLVLIEPRTSFPRNMTRLLVLDTPSLGHRATITLRGDFSFDAVSPNGLRIYLINYTSPNDPTRYAVRSFDLAAMRLDPKPIVDPRNPHEKMRGNPISRVASPDGRWAYTLYDGAAGTPFVHALDTRAAAARCIDLDGLDSSRVWRLRLRLSQRAQSVSVIDGPNTLLTVDTRTFAVAAPRAPGGSWLWVAAASAAVALAPAAVGVGLTRRRSGRRAAPGAALRGARSVPAETTRA